MSLEASRWAASDAPRVRGAARALLAVLAEMANARHGHTCWPAIATLASRLHCSERTIQRYIGVLEAAGDIAVRSGGGHVNGGGGRRNVYTFPALVYGDNVVTVERSSTVTNLVAYGDNPDVSTVTNLVAYGDKVVTPIKQPNINHQSINQETSSAQTDDDDLAAPFRSELAELAQRTLTDGERGVIDQHAATADGRAQVSTALDRLRARWPEIIRRDNLAGWLASTLRNLAGEGSTAPVDAARYAHEPTTIDEMRMEHAIGPEPIPAYVSMWEDAVDELRLELPAGAFDLGVYGVEAVHGDDCTLTVRARHAHGREFLQGRLRHRCESVLQRVAGRPVALVIE
jgi:hypothetical protein